MDLVERIKSGIRINSRNCENSINKLYRQLGYDYVTNQRGVPFCTLGFHFLPPIDHDCKYLDKDMTVDLMHEHKNYELHRFGYAYRCKAK